MNAAVKGRVRNASKRQEDAMLAQTIDNEGIRKDKPTKKKVVTKTPCVVLTKKAKLFQSMISFLVVCSIFESGIQADRSRQHAIAYSTYRSHPANFIVKEGVFAKITEYKRNEFAEETMMLAKGSKVK